MQLDINLMFEDGTTTTFNAAATFQDCVNNIKLAHGGAFINQSLGEPTVLEAMVTTDFGSAGSNLWGLKAELFYAADSSGSPGSFDSAPAAEAMLVPPPNATFTITLSTALVASNSTTVILNGVTLGPNVFATDAATSLTALVNLINANAQLAAMGVRAAYVDTTHITLTGAVQFVDFKGAAAHPFVTTAGAGQPTYTVSGPVKGTRAVFALPPMPVGKPWAKLRILGLGTGSAAFASFASYVGKIGAGIVPAELIVAP